MGAPVNGPSLLATDGLRVVERTVLFFAVVTLTLLLLSFSLVADMVKVNGDAGQAQGAPADTALDTLLTMLALMTASAGLTGVAYMRLRRRTAREFLRARNSIDETLRRAREMNAAKTDFLASMSHEIRTPLNGIIGYADLLGDSRLSRDQRRYVERMQFACAALLATVNDILDFSKIEAGHLSVELAPLRLTTLLNNATSIVAATAEKKGLQLDVEVSPDLPPVFQGDETRIRQVLLNLLNNACKFTSQGHIELVVDKIDRVSGPCIRFTVNDTGIGIGEEEMEHLFERFYQVEHAHLSCFEGTGLGLAISKSLVSLMGGEIGVRRRETGGATFWFTLPCITATAQTWAAPARQATVVPPGRKGRILLVEDLPYNRDIAQEILIGAGHHVDCAQNGAEAVEMVSRTSYDLILMDLQMPVMDGLLATRRIRALDGPVRDIPVIALTANVLPHQIKQFAEVELNDHIPKPFHKQDLLTKISAILDLRGSAPVVQTDKGSAIETDPQTSNLLDPDRMQAALVELRRRVERTLCDNAGADRLALARSAHDVISLAGILGHGALSKASVELEQACHDNKGIAAALSKTRAAAEASFGTPAPANSDVSTLRNMRH